GAEAPPRQGAQAADRLGAAETAEVSPAAAGRERFPSRYRLRKRHEFLTVQREGRRHAAPHFVVITRPAATAVTRLGITTSRKVGSAPQRNRIRRLVREFFRRHRT